MLQPAAYFRNDRKDHGMILICVLLKQMSPSSYQIKNAVVFSGRTSDRTYCSELRGQITVTVIQNLSDRIFEYRMQFVTSAFCNEPGQNSYSLMHSVAAFIIKCGQKFRFL